MNIIFEFYEGRKIIPLSNFLSKTTVLYKGIFETHLIIHFCIVYNFVETNQINMGELLLSKSMFVDCLVDMSTSTGMSTDIPDTSYITYFTSTGIVVGKEAVLAGVEADSLEELVQSYKEILAEKSSISLIEMASGLFEHRVKHYLDDVPSEHQAIILEDVQILTANNVVINSPQFVLFKDQIVGITSGKINLSQLKA